uniref:Uncharacterized protein n=1 Tax=Anguilla anguilla TaxID=7936 RepID=A0A0E9THU1_ANGAN
MLVLKFTALE